MKKYFLSQKAKADLKEIGRYTMKKWGAEQRDKYIQAMYKCFEQIAADDSLSTDCSYISKGYRKLYIGRHVIFFKASTDGNVDIVRVLHQSMDVKLQLLH